MVYLRVSGELRPRNVELAVAGPVPQKLMLAHTQLHRDYVHTRVPSALHSMSF